MRLDRKKTMEYARTHWFTTCDDNLIYTYVKGTVDVRKEQARLQREGKLPGTGWRAVLLPELNASNQVVPDKERGCFIRANPSGQEIIPRTKPPELSGRFDLVTFYQHAGEHDGLVDCAHYVSRCLTAGGISINHADVPGLVHDLREGSKYSRFTRTLGLEVTRESGDRIMNSGVMEPGDLITYVHENPKTHVRGYQHSALYTGFDAKNKVHRLTCHTIARFNEFFFNTPWNITVDPEWRFTLIHFLDRGFPPLPQPLRFEVTQGGKSEVYDFKPDGHVGRARQPLPSRPAFGVRPEDRGYWFIHGFKLFVFWPVTGQVATVGFVSFDDLGNFPIDIDGKPAQMRSLDGAAP
jgi:hypothetical protein